MELAAIHEKHGQKKPVPSVASGDCVDHQVVLWMTSCPVTGRIASQIQTLGSAHAMRALG